MSEEPAAWGCDLCGRREQQGAATLAWTTAVESGRRRHYCTACSREHLRAMEAELDISSW